MKKSRTKLEWITDKNRLLMAGEAADLVVEQLRLTAPIDPLEIVRSEKPLLRAGGRNFGDRYDGKLEYNRENNCFLLFFNTKYDSAPEVHHPRTRFSIAHELGHYFLEKHRTYLMRTQQAHASISEFRSDNLVEREADSFAASLLLPTRLVRPMINQHELSVDRIIQVANRFDSSLVSTTFRCVSLSDFPCAIAGIKEGSVMWMFPSSPMIEAGIYPEKNFLPANAQDPWKQFQFGVAERSKNEGRVSDWFNTFGNDEVSEVYVTEEYIPISSMGMLLVLLTLDESDIYPDTDDYD